MSLLRMYTIFDVKSESFNTPFFQVNDEVSKRTFLDLCLDKNTLMFLHPEDFILYGVGTFDLSNGALTIHGQLDYIATANHDGVNSEDLTTDIFKQDQHGNNVNVAFEEPMKKGN